MTKKELLKALKNVSDDAEIRFGKNPSFQEGDNVCNITTIAFYNDEKSPEVLFTDSDPSEVTDLFYSDFSDEEIEKNLSIKYVDESGFDTDYDEYEDDTKEEKQHIFKMKENID